jgi:hypothetical protein
MNTDTRTYSQLIAGELLAVETLLEGRPTGYDPAEIYDGDDEYAAYRDAINELQLDLDYDTDDNDPLTDYLNESCLEVTWYRSGDKTRAEILRTCGGPRCEISRDSHDGQMIEIRTYEAGEPVDTMRVWAPIMSEQLDMLASELAPQ